MAARLSCVLLFLFLFSISAGGAAAAGTGAARALWCVAKNNAEDAALQSALDWACGPGGADCGPIQNGGPCYEASDLPRTASYVFNDYYQKNPSSDDSCSFSNTAAVTDLNPSHGNCKFRSNSGNGNSSSGVDAADVRSSNGNSVSRRGLPFLFLFHFIFIISNTIVMGLV